jgi:uncharacterized membrane protein YuzA (DUF378 family)
VRILLIIGGINWGLVGLGMLFGGDWNVLHWIFSFSPILEAVVYLLVGIAGVIKIFNCQCKKCVLAPEDLSAQTEKKENPTLPQ